MFYGTQKSNINCFSKIKKNTMTMEEIPQIKASRVLHWTGSVTEEKLEKISADLAKISLERKDPIMLALSNFGGSCSYGFGFYDLVRFVLKPKLFPLVIGSVESMGIILFLAATEKRVMTKNSTLFLHETGKELKAGRYSNTGLRNLSKDNDNFHLLYANIVAENSNGNLSADSVLKMMHEEKRIFPEEAKELGLCDVILSV